MSHTLEDLQLHNKRHVVFEDSTTAFNLIVKLVWGRDAYTEWHRKEYGNYPCDGLVLFKYCHSAYAFFPSNNEYEGRKLCFLQALKNLENAYVGGNSTPWDYSLNR